MCSFLLLSLLLAPALFQAMYQVRVLAATCLLLLCFINCYSVKWSTMVRTEENVYWEYKECLHNVMYMASSNASLTSQFPVPGPGLFHLRQGLRTHHHHHHRVGMLSSSWSPHSPHLPRFVQLFHGKTEYFTWEDTETVR